jgi:ribosomal protein L37AE/L43A
MPGTATQTPPRDALDLRESITLTESVAPGESVFDEDGCVPIHIMRPCIGKGKGHHLYEADMLEANAGNFTGWKMYVDHESEQARKAAGGLPRKTRDLGGRIVESYWDGTVPADPVRGFGQGAIIGRAKPVRYIRELIEDDPEILEASIAASATGVRPVVKNGQRVWLVEGIEDRGSVDWVTEAGAGGRVAALIEASYDDDADEALLESMSDEDFLAAAEGRGLRLAEADSKAKPKKCPNCGHKVEFGRHKNCEKCGASMKKLAEADSTSEGDDMAEITPEQLEEALAAKPETLVTALAQSSEVQVFITSLVEAAVEEGREEIVAEVEAKADRRVALTEMAAAAEKQISEATQLPESWRAELVSKFSLVEGAPAPALDVVDDVDENGEVTKTAAEKLREAVEAEIKRERDRLAEASPTRVRGQGGSSTEIKEGADASTDSPGSDEDLPEWAQFLQEAGVDPDRAYAA